MDTQNIVNSFSTSAERQICEKSLRQVVLELLDVYMQKNKNKTAYIS